MTDRTSYFSKKVKDTVMRADPTALVMLYGSRARGDEREDSDWDIIIVVNKERADQETFMALGNPLYDIADENNISINPIIYTRRQWETPTPSLFLHNVKSEAIIL